MYNKLFRTSLLLLMVLIVISCNNEQAMESSSKNENKETISKLDSLSKVTITETRMTPELLWKFGRVFDAHISPDGNTVIYCVQRYDAATNKGYIDLFSVPSEGGEAKQLTQFAGPELNPRWSNDGSKIYFLASESGNMQIWYMNADGTDQAQFSEIEGDINSFEIAPDNSKFLYTKDVKQDTTPNEIHEDLPLANVRIYDDLMYRHWNAWHDYKYSHIFIGEVVGNKLTETKDIMKGERWDAPMSPWFDAASMCWTPDGKSIAYTCRKLTGVEYTLSTNSDIYLYNLESENTKNLTEGMMGYDQYPSFSPDGSKMAWLSMETPGYEADKDRLFVMDMTSGEKEYITENYDNNVSNIVWEDNENIYCISGVNATYQIYKVSLKIKEFIPVTQGIHNYNHFCKAGDIIIGERMSMQMATEIFKITEPVIPPDAVVKSVDGTEFRKAGYNNETQLTFTNQNIYDKIKLVEVESRWIKTTDYKNMLVWIIYPPDFDPSKKYPALLYCQGGPQSAVSQFFSYRWNFQMMAAHDYIVVAPNRRGLPTFGEEWNAQISGDYGGQNMKDYLSAIDAVKAEPFVDETKLGAVGASYGGFSVFWLAGNHDGRFSAFISHCGMFNLESQYAATEEMFFVNHDLGGPYWDKNNKTAQKSYANSPHKFIQNWDTPILIISGEYDFRIPYTESLQAFNAAKLVGVDARLMIFPDETHFVLKPQNSILWQREFFKFLDEHLKE